MQFSDFPSQDIQLSKNLLNTILNSSSEGMVLSNDKNQILYVNAAFTAITGYHPEDIIGKPGSVLRSERYEDSFYKELWSTVQTKDKWEGEFWVRRKNGEVFLEWLSLNAIKNSQKQIKYYLTIFSDITAQKTSEERIQFLSYHDPLTNLPNRLNLQDQIEILIKNERKEGIRFGLLALDIDHFQKINNSYGMLLGDSLLQKMAERINKELTEEQILVRHDSDEFIVLVPTIAKDTQLISLADKIMKIMKEPFLIEDKQIYCTASAGIAIYPTDGESSDLLIKNVNSAVHRAKELGRNNVQFYKRDMNAQAQEHLVMENKLHGALAADEFELHYQPQVSLVTGKITGVEALIRWKNAELGFVSPAKFIPIAENSGLIIPISEWVIKTACLANNKWQKASSFQIPVSVNISSLHFHQEDFKHKLIEFLKETKLDPQLLKLELTEGIIMEDSEKTINNLLSLKDLGLKLSIDDFGTGYSSLSYLKRFPIDQLKIDQSFVRNMSTDQDYREIIRAILSLAKTLQLSVVAEGVETKEQMMFLRDEGCDIIQGYYFSKPLPISDFIQLLHENKTLDLS